MPPYRALRIVLGFLCFLTAVGGVVAIFGSKAFFLRLFLHPPEAELSTLVLALTKELGGFLLMLSFMLLFAARDPAGNTGTINGLIAGLCVLAVTPLLILYTSDIRRLYPGYLIWGRSAARLALAALIYYLRPRGSPRSTS